MTIFKRFVASILIVSCTAMGLPLTAHAGIVSTEEVLTTETTARNRDHINSFLQRDDVRKAMETQGVDGNAALERVQAMSDAEVAQLAGRIDQAPVGGDILGLIFTVFIVLLVTDILGLTKVFPFTRSVR